MWPRKNEEARGHVASDWPEKTAAPQAVKAVPKLIS